MTKLLRNVAQICGDFFGYFEKCHFLKKTNMATIWSTFDKHWALFHLIIWSHCESLCCTCEKQTVWKSFIKKMGQPQPHFCLLSVFSNKHHYNFTTNISEKCPSSLRFRDLNLRPSECEFQSITTRPGIMPWIMHDPHCIRAIKVILYCQQWNASNSF